MDVALIDWCTTSQVLGPAALFFGEAAPVTAGGLAHLPVSDPRVRELLSSASADDAGESGLADVTSVVFAHVRGNSVVAAAGYKHWPGGLAHLSVLTHARWRRRGYASRVASAAIAAATQERLLPQWRARPVESQRLAQSLGLIHLGSQVSLCPDTGADG